MICFPNFPEVPLVDLFIINFPYKFISLWFVFYTDGGSQELCRKRMQDCVKHRNVLVLRKYFNYGNDLVVWKCLNTGIVNKLKLQS